jgi:hypothetical protein
MTRRPRTTTTISHSYRSRTTTTLPPTVTILFTTTPITAQGYGHFWKNSNEPSHTFTRKSQDNILNWVETKNGKTMDKYKLIATDDSKNEMLIYNGNKNWPAYIRLTRDSALFSTNKVNGFNPVYSGYWVY